MICAAFGGPRVSVSCCKTDSRSAVTAEAARVRILVCGITVDAAHSFGPCRLKTYGLHSAMNQFAAERYAQKLSIRYISGPRNHERHCRNAVAFASFLRRVSSP